MALKFLRETHDDILGKIQSDLAVIDPTIDLDRLYRSPLRIIQSELTAINESIGQMKSGVYGSWLRSEEFVKASLLQEAIRTIIDKKKNTMAGERLIKGNTYYTDVKRFGHMLEGKMSIFMGSEFSGWIPLKEHTAIAKAKQVLRFGTPEDFREIYVGLADGMRDFTEVSMDHITESTSEALSLIESYCDSRWEGPWPWEIEAPEKLKFLIENREEKKMKRIVEMQETFRKMLREFEDGAMNQFEMVSASQEMMSKVDSIISDLGKLSSTGIEVMAQAKATGDDQLVVPMQDALGDPLNNAVTALTDLKAALSRATSQLTGGSSMDAMGDDFGSPVDAMGDDPMGDTDADALADIDMGADEPDERPMKEI